MIFKRLITVIILGVSAHALILSGIIHGHQIALGVQTERLVVFDYWVNKHKVHHKIALYNPNDSLISVSIFLEEINIQTLRTESICKLKTNKKIPKNAVVVLDYPNIKKCMKRSGNNSKYYLKFTVDGKRGGLLPPSNDRPPFELAKGVIVTNCGYGGLHLENIWFVFHETFFQDKKPAIISARLICRSKNEQPRRIIFPQKKVEASLEIALTGIDDLIWQTSGPLVTENETVLRVPYCDPSTNGYKEIGITIDIPIVEQPEVLYFECYLDYNWKMRCFAIPVFLGFE